MTGKIIDNMIIYDTIEYVHFPIFMTVLRARFINRSWLNIQVKRKTQNTIFGANRRLPQKMETTLLAKLKCAILIL